jgi:hypothetical protein
MAFGRFKRYKNPGAQLYVPDRVFKDEAFPFKEGEVVKIRIEGNRVVQEKAEWWELLDWSKLPDAYAKLPSHIRDQIEKSRVSEN